MSDPSPAELPLAPDENTKFGEIDEESPKELGRTVEPAEVVDRGDNMSLSIKALRQGYTVSRLPSTLIDIDSLPEDIQTTLRPMDINGDGKISLTELVHGAVMQHEREEKVIFFRRLILVFILVWLLTMGAFFGVVIGAIEASKDSKVSDGSNVGGGAALVTRDEAYIIQTANSDFFVGQDGSAYVRTVTSQTYEQLEGSSSGEDPQYNVMKTSAAHSNITFTSSIPDEVLMELKSISIRSAAGAHLSLQVNGVLRMPVEGSATEGAVTIITAIGRIVIDGTAVSFYDDTDVAIFENAGFIVQGGSSTGGRRLLDGILALYGIFNAVASLKDWKESSPRYANIAPPTLPNNFVMHSRRFAPCIVNPNQDGSVVDFPDYLGGTLPVEPGVDYCDLLQINTDLIAVTYVNNTRNILHRFIETEYVIYRVGSDYLRVEYVHPLHPEVTFVEVLDNSDPQNPLQFHYNVDTSTKGLVMTPVLSELEIVEFKGPVYYYNASSIAPQSLVDQALSAPFDYLGTTQYEGAEVRIWAMHLMNNTVHAYWYDSVDTRQVQRIDYGNFGMLDVVGLTAINDTDAATMSFLFSAPIANFTEIVTGQTDHMPYRVGVNPYEPFVAEYSAKIAAQSSSQRTAHTKMATTSTGEQMLVAPKHLLIKNAEARRRVHVPGSETAPASRSSAYWQQAAELKLAHGEDEEDLLLPTEPELSPEEFAVLERAAVEAQERAALEEDRPHTAEEAAAPVIRAQPAHLQNGSVILDRHSRVLQSVYRTCPAGWVAYLDVCYYFYSSSYQGSWNTCNSLCSTTPFSQMLCITDAAQNRFLADRISERGIKRIWINMKKDSNNRFRWGSTCSSSFYKNINTESFLSNSVVTDSAGTWFAPGPVSYSCACQNTFPVPTAPPTALPTFTKAPTTSPTTSPTLSPTSAPSSSAPISRPTTSPTALPVLTVRPTPAPSSLPTTPIITNPPISSPTTKPTQCPTRAPSMQPTSTKAPTTRPTTKPTQRPTSAPNTLPLNLPPRTIPSDISPVSSAFTRLFGCAADNKCDAYYLWYTTLEAPFTPVLTAVGNDKFPCVFSTGVDAPIPIPPIPVIEIVVDGGVEIGYCNDFSAIDYIIGTMGVSLGITGLDYVPIPYDSMFSYTVARVSSGVTIYLAEDWCSVQNGVATYSSNDAYGLLRHIATTSKGPQICRCLEKRQSYPGFIQMISGPDIPGLVLAVIPIFSPLLPFLPFMRITNAAQLENFPDVCSLAITRSGMSMDFEVNFGFFSYSLNVFTVEMSLATKSGVADFIGAMMNLPRGVDAFVDQARFANRYLDGPFNRAATVLISVLDTSAMLWIQVVRLGGQLASAAKNYFNQRVEEGKILSSAAGDLYRLFKPPPVVVYGCFDPRISEPQCTRRVKVFGRRICYSWSMPQITCGSTQQCIKYC